MAWWGILIEGYSAFARLRREDILDDVGEQEACDCLNPWTSAWTEMEPSMRVGQCCPCALTTSSSTADSLQLAAALVWANQNGRGHEFVYLDRRLRGCGPERRIFGPPS